VERRNQGPLSSRFARVVVWVANGLVQGKTMEECPEELLIEWPEGDAEPWKYWLSILPPQRTSFRGLIRKAKGRFRIEQDYEEMKGRSAWITLKVVPGRDGIIMSPWLPWLMPS